MKSKTALIRGGIFLRSRRALWMRDQQHDALRISRRLREVIADTIRERTDVPRSGIRAQALCRCRGGRSADQDRLGSHRWAR